MNALILNNIEVIYDHVFLAIKGVSIEVPQGAEVLLMFNDSEPSFAETDQHHRLALTDAFSSVNSYEDRPCAPGNLVNPSVT